jgi:hypothetical protein
VNQELFSSQIGEIMSLPPEQRHARMLALHRQIYDEYTAAVVAITDERAAAPPAEGSKDKRTLLQIVGTLAEWDRFAIMSAGDVLSGVAHPRMITEVDGFVALDGRQVPLDDINDFNMYQSEQYVGAPWKKTQALALDMADVLLALFTDPTLLNAARLERTQSHKMKLADGTRLNDVSMGWVLWITILQHEGVEYAAQLAIEGT